MRSFIDAEPDAGWHHAVSLLRPILALAPVSFLGDLAQGLAAHGIQAAVTKHDAAPIYDWIMRSVSLQGVSDRVAFAFDAHHGGVSFADVTAGFATQPECRKLAHHWAFHGCGYRKGTRTCANPMALEGCPVPRLPLRKGSLNRAAYGLALFLRDICEGDFVGWIDQRLAGGDPGLTSPGRAVSMRTAVLEPLCEIGGIGPKVWSMILADLLLAGDPRRERWVSTGAAMIAIDSLVHNFFHRTGILHRLGAQHDYGDACYGQGGCADIVQRLAGRIDARSFNPNFPSCSPRFVQFAVWSFCAADRRAICNGNEINDAHRCGQTFCPTFHTCDRVPMRPEMSEAAPESARLRKCGFDLS